MLQTITFAGARVINAKARFFKYETGSASGSDESIRVRADGNDLGLFLPGDAVELDEYATMWEVAPVTISATGACKLGAGRVTSSRIAGTVRTIDSARDRVLSKAAFMVGANVVAVGGQYPYGQLFVAAAAPFRAVIERIYVSSATAGVVYLRGHGASLGAVSIPAAGTKYMDGSTIANLSTYTANLANTAAATLIAYSYMNIPAAQSMAFDLRSPIIVPPGTGLVMLHTGLGADLTVTFDGYVEPLQ